MNEGDENLEKVKVMGQTWNEHPIRDQEIHHHAIFYYAAS